MENFKNAIAIFLSLIMLLNSCAVYQGDYSLNEAVKNSKKVKVKSIYNEYLLYDGKKFKYERKGDYHAWSLISLNISEKKPSVIQNPTKYNFSDIIFVEDSYYGFTNFENRGSWVKLISPNLMEVPKTKREQFKKVVYQEGNYWGVINEDETMDLVPIHEDQVKKVSQYDPVLSVLGSILITPLVLAIILFVPDEN